MSLHLIYPALANHLKRKLGLDQVFVGDPPENVAVPYLFTWGPVPVRDAAPLALVDERVNVQVVAKAIPDVNALASRVVTALDGFQPEIDGYDCQPLRVRHTTNGSTDTQMVEPSADSRPAYLTVVCQFRANKSLGGL